MRVRVTTAARAIASMLAGLFGVWLLCWHLWLGALWWGLLAWTLRARRGWLRWAVLLAGGVPLVPWTLWRYTARVDVLTERMLAHGPNAFGVPDLLGIWGLNVVMGVAGFFLGFPEVAAETLLLIVPRGPTVTVPSDFPLCVPRIARFVDGHRQGGSTRVLWTYSGDESFRGGLALNPAGVRVGREGDRLVVHTTVPIDYTGHYRLVFGRLGPLEASVEEGFFHVLQERGWLFPYRLTYRSTLGADEPLPGPCEAWPVRLGRAVIPR